MINHLVDIMTKKIKIDFVSDAVCPWCAIGYTRLKQAISELDLQDKVTIAWQPFFLNPDIAPEGDAKAAIQRFIQKQKDKAS